MPLNPLIKRRRYVRLSTESNTTDHENVPQSDTQLTDEHDKDVHSAPWHALFLFTTRKYTLVLAFAIVLSIASGAAVPAQSFIIGKLFDGFVSFSSQSITQEQFLHQETKYVLHMLILAGASWLIRSLEFMTWLAFGELQASSARHHLFKSLLRKDLTWYDKRTEGMGAMLARLQTHMRELQLATAQPLGTLFTVSATALLSLAQAFALSWSLTLVTISTVPVVLACIIWAGRGMQDHIQKQDETLTEAQTLSINAFHAVETVKCFNGQRQELKHYRESINSAAHWYTRIAHANAMQMALFVFVSISTFVQGFYYGSILVSKGQKSTAQVITTFLSAIDAFMSIQEILPQMIVLEKGRTAGYVLRSATVQGSIEKTLSSLYFDTGPTNCYGDIDVQNLSFAYPKRPDHMVLNHISLHIPGGQTMFLIGRSGSGKSTLVQLLLQFYPLQHGQITLDGQPIATLDSRWLRSNITLVEQSNVIFDDSIFENIALGRRDGTNITESEVMAAAEFALLEPMLTTIPEGIQSNAGHGGSLLSGGQRQRIALARAKVRDTPILILDESTSALDQTSRELIMSAIRRWRRGKTTIIITHDVSQIGQDDHAIVLENGRLFQQGCRKHMEGCKDTPFQRLLMKTKDRMGSSHEARGSDVYLIETDQDSMSNLSHANIAEQPFFRASRPPSRSQSSPRLVRYGSNTAYPMDRPAADPHFRSSIELEDMIVKPKRLRVAMEESSATLVTSLESMDVPCQAAKVSYNDKGQNLAKDDTPIYYPALPLRKVLGTVWPSLNWPYRLHLIIGFCAATVHAVASPVFANVLSNLLDTYSIPGGDEQQALTCALEILAIALTDATQVYLFRLLLELVSQRWVDSLRSQALERLLDQPMFFFEKEENTPTLLAESLDRNAEEMRNLLGRFATYVYIAVLLCAISIAWAIITQWALALTAFAIVPYIYAVSAAFTRISSKWETLSNDAHEDTGAVFAETFTHIRTVKALTLETYFLRKYAKTSTRTLAIGLQRSFYVGVFYGCSDASANISIAILFYVGSQLVVSGVSVNSVIQVLTILMITVANVNAILAFIPQIGSSMDTASRLLRLAQLPKNSHEHLGQAQINSVGDIVCNQLSFAYPSRPHHSVLQDLTLRIPAGSITALVGESGCGKSTIANLLLRLYPIPDIPPSSTFSPACPPYPKITLGNRDIQTLSTLSLREHHLPFPRDTGYLPCRRHRRDASRHPRFPQQFTPRLRHAAG